MLLAAIVFTIISVTYFAIKEPEEVNVACQVSNYDCSSLWGGKSIEASGITITEAWGPFGWGLAILALPCLLLAAVIRCCLLRHHHHHEYEQLGKSVPSHYEPNPTGTVGLYPVVSRSQY
jgi:hypothetical protein